MGELTACGARGRPLRLHGHVGEQSGDLFSPKLVDRVGSRRLCAGGTEAWEQEGVCGSRFRLKRRQRLRAHRLPTPTARSASASFWSAEEPGRFHVVPRSVGGSGFCPGVLASRCEVLEVKGCCAENRPCRVLLPSLLVLLALWPCPRGVWEPCVCVCGGADPLCTQHRAGPGGGVVGGRALGASSPRQGSESAWGPQVCWDAGPGNGSVVGAELVLGHEEASALTPLLSPPQSAGRAPKARRGHCSSRNPCGRTWCWRTRPRSLPPKSECHALGPCFPRAGPPACAPHVLALKELLGREGVRVTRRAGLGSDLGLGEQLEGVRQGRGAAAGAGEGGTWTCPGIWGGGCGGQEVGQAGLSD